MITPRHSKHLALAAFALAVALLASCGTDPTGTNAAPDIRLDVPTTFDYVVGEGRVTITITAEDPDGQDVTIGMTNKPDRATLQQFDGWAVFDWDPLASDITDPTTPLGLIFYAEDSLGARAERVVSIFIRAGNGVPRFENSPSVLYNTDSGKPLIFEVRVRDNDSERVAISMPIERAPAGARYIVGGDFGGRFEWTPTEDQLQFRVHSVTFTADDGQNPTVEQKVSILFKKSGGTDETRPDIEDPTDPAGSGCNFEDRVRHTPLPAQRITSPYRVTATLAGDAVGRYDRLVLNWTDQDAYNINELQLEGAEMANEGGTFVGNIPNPLLPPGQSREIYYEICAIDDDSTDDDSVLCGPTSIYHSFIAYSPNDIPCADDAFVNSSFETALDLEGVEGWEHHRACSGTDDYYRMELAPFQDADVFFTYPFGSTTRVEMFDDARNPLPLEMSSCAGFAYASAENQTDQPATRYFKVTGHEVPYQVGPYFYTPASSCSATDIEPNDDAASAAPIPTDGTTTALQEICGPSDIDIFSFPVTAGQEITARTNFVHANGDIDMKLYAPSALAALASNGIGTAFSLSISDNEVIQHVAQETGTYYLRVFGYSQPNTYTASVDVAAGCTDDDSFGNNHTLANAADASAFTVHRGLEVCASQDDWYAFFGFMNEAIDVSVRITSGDAAAVSVSVHRDGAVAATGTLNGSTVMASVDVATDGEYQLQVSATRPVEYELTIEPFSL